MRRVSSLRPNVIAVAPADIPPNTVQVRTGIAGIGTLLTGWEEVSAALPTAQAIWYQACAKAFGGHRLWGAVAEEAGSKIAAAVLRWSSSREHVLEILGAAELGEPGDLLYRDHKALWLLLKEIARRRVVLTLGRVPEESPTPGLVRQACRGRAVVVTRPQRSYAFIPIEGESPEEVFSASLRADLRRAQRKAERLGSVQLEVHAPRDEASFRRLFEEALAVERSGWKGASGTALGCDGRRRMFFEEYGVAAAQAGILRICFLRLEGRAAAMQYAVECGQAFWLLKIGYEEAFRACSPGMLLMAATLRYAWQRRLRTYELMGQNEGWLRRWPIRERKSVGVTVYPFSLRGVSALAGDGRRYLQRRLPGRLPS